MTNESNLVLEIWETIRDHLPSGKRGDMIVGILRACEEYGFEKKDLRDLLDEDPYLVKGFVEVFEDHEEDEVDEIDFEN